jgi:hypothetical protein
MPRLTQAQPRPDATSSFLSVAKAFYGPAFSPRRKSELAEAMADWAELTPDEQSFAIAHLHYLNLVAQAGTQRLLADVRELLEELVENVDDALDDLPGLDDDDAVAPDVEDLEEDVDPDEPTDDEVPEGYLVELPPLESDDDEPSADEADLADDEVPDDAA